MAERDLRQLVWHRPKLVWMRNAVGNQLQALAMGEGVCRKKELFTKKGRAELEGLGLGVWASHRRQELLTMLDPFDAWLRELDGAVAEPAEQNAAALRLMTQPGVGPVTSLALVLTLGPGERFERSKQVVSYLGLNPREHSSGGRQRFGAISAVSCRYEIGHPEITGTPAFGDGPWFSTPRRAARIGKDYRLLRTIATMDITKAATRHSIPYLCRKGIGTLAKNGSMVFLSTAEPGPHMRQTSI
jgi:hypothetical protein